MAVTGLVPMPLSDPMVTARNPNAPVGKKDPTEGLMTPEWVPFFTNQNQIVAQTPQKISPAVALTGQVASISLTAIPAGVLAAGQYQVSFHFRITTAATSSSSLLVTLSWTDGGIACSKASAAVTTNTISTTDDAIHEISVDQSTAVSYATTYASVGATPMAYKLNVNLTKL